jgi:hypothetical protein
MATIAAVHNAKLSREAAEDLQTRQQAFQDAQRTRQEEFEQRMTTREEGFKREVLRREEESKRRAELWTAGTTAFRELLIAADTYHRALKNLEDGQLATDVLAEAHDKMGSVEAHLAYISDEAAEEWRQLWERMHYVNETAQAMTSAGDRYKLWLNEQQDLGARRDRFVEHQRQFAWAYLSGGTPSGPASNPPATSP